MANVVQRSFAGGEIAPALYARTDQVKYATGLRTCRNFLVQRGGGVANRPGTSYLGETRWPGLPVRLVKFVFNADQTYVLEFGEWYMRIYRNGARVIVSDVSAWIPATAYAIGALVVGGGVNYYCTTAHTADAGNAPGSGADWQSFWHPLEAGIFEIPTPYRASVLGELQFAQTGDVVTIVHPSHPPRELRRLGHTNWQLIQTTFGPRIGTPSGLGLAGGSAGTSRAWLVTAIDALTGEEGLAGVIAASGKVPSPENPTTVTWNGVTGAARYNVYRGADPAAPGFVGVAGGAPIQTTDALWTVGEVTTTFDYTFDFAQASPNAVNPVVALAVEKAYDGRYTVKGALDFFVAPGGTVTRATARVLAYAVCDGVAIVETAIELGFAELVGGAVGTGQSFERTMVVPDNGYSTLEIRASVSVYVTKPVVGNPDVTATLRMESVAWSIGGTAFVDEGAVPDYGVAPPLFPKLFNTSGAYPGAVALYQQRRAFANTLDEPEKVWTSRSGVFANFARSTPLQDDDAVTFTLAGRQVNEVRHLLDLGRLLVFTSGAVLSIEGGADGILRPGEVNPRQQAANGAHPRFPPLVVVNTALYVQARGTIVRSLVADAIQGYRGTDMGVFASHLFKGKTLVDWDYAETPDSIVWVVRSDGVLLGLTYVPEHEVWGWHRHDTDGAVENVCVVPEGSEDAVYLVVRRTIGGVEKRYVERMASRAFASVDDAHFVDCGLAYDGWNTSATTMMVLGFEWTPGSDHRVEASAAAFVPSDVGNAMFLLDATGRPLRCTITEYQSNAMVAVLVDRDVPVELRNAETTAWARAVDQVAGLDHLEGKAVSVFADGFVVASPNNSTYPVRTVTGGTVTLDRPYARILVGLPYISDLETLDIDGAQGPSLKDKRMLVTRVGLFVEASRGVFAGPRAPAGDDPLAGLAEHRPREAEDPNAPPALVTDAIEVNIESNWNSNGRILVRQVDPLPLTILSVTPQGHVPTGP